MKTGRGAAKLEWNLSATFLSLSFLTRLLIPSSTRVQSEIKRSIKTLYIHLRVAVCTYFQRDDAGAHFTFLAFHAETKLQNFCFMRAQREKLVKFSLAMIFLKQMKQEV